MNAAANRCARCRALVKWATTAAGKAIPLDPDPVEPASRGAFALIGDRAMGRADAVRRVGELFEEDDETADRRTMTEYSWHLAHFATCIKPNRRDEP